MLHQKVEIASPSLISFELTQSLFFFIKLMQL
jgi:hypothetical protein